MDIGLILNGMKTLVVELSQWRTWRLLWFAFACMLVTFVVAQLIKPLYVANFGSTGGPDLADWSKTGEFVIVCIVAPIIETFLFQLLPIYLVLRIPYFKKHYLVPVLVSAACFAAVHHYSVLYILYAFVAGCIYSISFLVFREQVEGRAWAYIRALGLTALAHSMFNFFGFLFLIYKSI